MFDEFVVEFYFRTDELCNNYVLFLVDLHCNYLRPNLILFVHLLILMYAFV